VAALLSLGDQGPQPVHIDLRASVGVTLGISMGKKRRHLWAIKSGNNLLQSTNHLRGEIVLGLTAFELSRSLTASL
jgi:hypothetical protein